MKTSGLGGKRPAPKVFEDLDRPKSNKERSVIHEKRLETTLNSKATINSGALPNISWKGDLQDSLFVWQAKLTEKDRFTVTSDVLVELKRQASLNSKWPGMAITIEGLPSNLEQDWVMLPASVFRELLENYLK